MYVRLLFQFKINELTHGVCPIDPNQKGLLTIKTFVPSVCRHVMRKLAGDPS